MRAAEVKSRGAEADGPDREKEKTGFARGVGLRHGRSEALQAAESLPVV